MTFGIETYRPNGSVMMDGSNKAGIFIELLFIPSDSTSGSKTYDIIPTGSIYYVIASSGGRHTVRTGSDGAGRAQITWTVTSNSFQISTYVMVFARKVNQTTSYGVVLTGESGDMLADFTYPVPQYIKTMEVPANQGGTPTFYNLKTLNTATITVQDTRTDTNRVVLLYLPDSTANDYWYACDSFIPKGTNIKLINIYCLSPANVKTFILPSIHIFSLDGPISGGGSYGTQYFGPKGELVYDSSAENISVKDIARIETSGHDGPASSYTLAMPAQAGVAIPFYDYERSNTETGFNRYLGMAQRKGSTLSYKIHLVENKPATANYPTLLVSGNVEGGGCMVVDVSQLNPTAVVRSRP